MTEVLSGWGRTQPARSHVVAPRSEDEVLAALGAASGGVIARGLGRSYGDAAQLAGGTVLDGRGLDAIDGPDPATGELVVGAGASLQAVLERCVPKGFFVPVTPGTRQVTVGGAIAADVHGKNHHRDGAFGAHVRGLRLATPTGVHQVGPDTDPELFDATTGGMGLTGVVTEATLSLLEIETDRVIVDTDRCEDLDDVMARMVERDAAYRYSVAWVDCTTTGRRLGRAVLTRGDHARRGDLPARRADRPLRAPGPPRVSVPLPAPPGLLNALSIRAFNEAWFRRAPRHRVGELVSLGAYFHPLDSIGRWNLLYGPRGVVQYQLAVPDSAADAVRQAIELLATSGVPSFLGVLKRFGPAGRGPLSFPIEGWTLALDVPVGPSQLPSVLDRLDELVAGCGGRVYLAKDARLSPRLLPVMYPRLGELQEVRARVDPRGELRSDLAVRLGIG